MFEGNGDVDEKIPFVGRRREVEEIKAWLRVGRHRLVQIYGPPFTGKQRLAKQILKEIHPECRYRQIPLKCIEILGEFTRNWNEWLEEFLSALGIQSDDDDDTEHGIVKHVKQIVTKNKSLRLLFLFTKIDTILSKPDQQDQFVRFCKNLIRYSAKIFFLVTSQKRVVLPSSISARATFLTGVSETEGCVLFESVAKHHIHGWMERVSDIVRGCWYLPGLVKEAAMLLDHPNHVVNIDDLVKIVQSPGSLMRILSFQKQKLQRFFERMSDSAKKGAMLLTLFKGSFSKSAATEVLSATENKTESDGVSLVEMCDHSLVSRCSSGSDRYTVPTFLREFLAEKIQNIADFDPGRLQFTKFFCRTLQNVDEKVYTHGRERVIGHLHGDFENIRELMQQTMHCTEDMFPLLIQTVVSTEELFTTCFPNQEVKTFYDSLMKAASVYGTDKDRALIQWLIAQNSSPYVKGASQQVDVLELCQAAHNVLETGGPSYHLAAIKGLMGQTHNRRGNSKHAKRLLLEALHMLSSLERSMTTIRREVTLLSHLAISEVVLGNHSDSELTVDRGMLVANRNTPYHPAIAVMLNTMGLIWENSGRSQLYAMRYYKWSLSERRRHSYFREENLVPALLNVSLQLVRTGKCCAALDTLQEALDIRKEFGWVNHFTAVTLYYIGVVQMQMGNYPVALEYNNKAFNMLELCTPEHAVNMKVIDAIAHCYLAMGDKPNARKSFQRAMEKYQNGKTDDAVNKICVLRHNLLLGNTSQRQNAFSYLQNELLKTSDTKLNTEGQISDCRRVFSSFKDQSWNEYARLLLRTYCSLCKNMYRVFPNSDGVQIQTNMVYRNVQSPRQPSESCDTDTTETDRGGVEPMLQSSSKLDNGQGKSIIDENII